VNGFDGYLAWLEVRDLGPDPANLLLREALGKRRNELAPPGSAAGLGFVRFNHATSLPLLDERLARLGSVFD
jgi:cysteine-S-conjugate beta-lyase